MVATTSKINNCAKTKSTASLQARHELAKIAPVETDELNENDIRVVAAQGDNCTRWARAKDADELIKEWNDANPAPAAK